MIGEQIDAGAGVGTAAADDPEVTAALASQDAGVRARARRVLDLQRALAAYQEQLEQAQAVLARFPSPPPDNIGTWFAPQRNPEFYDVYQPARAIVDELTNPEFGQGQTFAKARADLQTARTQLADAIDKASPPTPTNRPIVNVPTDTPGVEQPSVFDPATGNYVPATGPGGEPLPTRGSPTHPPAGSKRTELKQGQDGNTYVVTYKADGHGNWALDLSTDPQPYNLGTDPGAPIALQTAQTNLAIAQQRLAEATSPEARAQAQLAVQKAQLDLQTAQTGLEQTQARAPVDLATAQTNLAIAQQRLAEATSPEAKEQARITLEKARFELEQARELGPLAAETARANLARAQTLADPVAEYQRQVQLQQQQATTYRDQLNDKVLRGELTVEDASSQFDRWWDTNVEARLTPYRTMAEGAYRKEQNEYQQRQAAEQARVDAINRQREQTAHAAGEKARQDLMTLAPQGRSPEFLNQLAENVSRIGQPLPGGPAQHGGGMRFSPESLSLGAVQRSQPSITGVGQAAVARALAQISPAAAQSVGAPPPQVPSLPQFTEFMGRAPFRLPDPTRPLAGSEALDLGNPAIAGRLGLPVQPGQALTIYEGGRREPWQIPQG